MKMGRRITFNRGNDNSNPMTNNSITTPISLAANTRAGSRTKASSCGPNKTPVAR